MNEDTRHFRDEMNLAEFPLVALTGRSGDQPFLVFTDTIHDRGRGMDVVRKVTVSPSTKYGLPTAKDEEVIMGLIQLTSIQDFTHRTVPFNRRKLLRLLGWRIESKSYHRLKDSLFRWLGVTIQYDKAWWSNADKCWVDRGFHLLDEVNLIDKAGGDQEGHSTFTWNETVFRSFQDGYLKRIDFDFYRSLESDLSKRLYRYLDKKFHRRRTVEFALRTLASEKLGASGSYHTGELKRLLSGPIRELENRGYLAPDPARFVKEARGEWKVCFQLADSHLVSDEARPAAEENPLVKALTAQGVSAPTAENLVAVHPPERIHRQLAKLDWMRKQRKPLKSAAGFLVWGIRHEEETSAPQPPKPPVACNRPAPSMVSAPPEPKEDRSNLERFWNELTDSEKRDFEAEALAQAHRFLVKQYRSTGSGSLFETVRRKILDDHIRRKLKETMTVAHP